VKGGCLCSVHLFFQLTCLYMLLIKEVIGKRENFNPFVFGLKCTTQSKTIHMQSILQPFSRSALLGSWSIYVHHIHCPLSLTHTHTHTSKSVCLTRIFLICFGCLHIQMQSDKFFLPKKKKQRTCVPQIL